MTDTATYAPPPSSAMAPVPYRVRSRVTENRDSATLCLEPVREPLPAPQPGEFMMMYAFGIGEVAISVSGDPTVTDGTITHTIRSVGAVSRALHDARAGHGHRDARPVRHQLGSGRRRRARPGHRRRRGRPGAAAARRARRARRPRPLRQGDADRGCPLARRLPVRRRTARLGPWRLHRGAHDRRRAGAGLAGRGRVRHRAAAPAAAAVRTTPPRSCAARS